MYLRIQIKNIHTRWNGPDWVAQITQEWPQNTDQNESGPASTTSEPVAVAAVASKGPSETNHTPLDIGIISVFVTESVTLGSCIC